MRIAKFIAMFGVVAAFGVAFVPQAAHALSALCSAAAAATATASPTPSPGFVVGVAFAAPGANPTLTLPSAGSTPVAAGDCMALLTASSTNPPLLTTSANFQGTSEASIATAVWTTGSFFYTYTHYVTPQDIATGHLTLTGVGSGGPVCAAFYRHVTCGYDAVAAQTANNGTAPAPGAATSTINGDLDVVGVIGNPQAGVEVYTPGSGYTNDVFLSGVNATSFGCAIDHLVQSTAGATTPGASTWTNITQWGAVHWFMQNIGGTK